VAYRIVISEAAFNDEYAAYEWYEKQQLGLGEELLAELEFAYKKISANLQHYGYIDDNKELRDFSLRRFPYAVIYRVKGDVVQVISVHHFKKKQP
jgi:hypothetical protein